MIAPSHNGNHFPATHWTIIAATDGPERPRALEALYRIYWRPLCTQARRFGVADGDAEDVVQEFLVTLFGSGSLQRADPIAGRFRSYLVGALRHSVVDRFRREHAQKRGGGLNTMPLEEAATIAAEDVDWWEFDLEWAQALLAQAKHRFAEEIRATLGGPSFEVLRDFALGEESASYENAAEQLGITVAAVKSRIFRMRHRFRQITREEVARTVSCEAECEDELRYLCTVLERAEGRSAANPA